MEDNSPTMNSPTFHNSEPEIEQLLRSDYTKDEPGDQSSITLEDSNDTAPTPRVQLGGEAADERTGEEKAGAVGGEDLNAKVLRSNVSMILANLFADRIGTGTAADYFVQALKQYLVKTDTESKSDESSSTLENPVKELEASAHDLNGEFLTLMVPKRWADEPIYFSLFDDGWEICRAKDHPMGTFAGTSWNDDMAEELSELRRLRNELGATLETVLQLGRQTEKVVEAMLQGGLSAGEYRGMQLLIRYLSREVQKEILRHLTFEIEVTCDDRF